MDGRDLKLYAERTAEVQYLRRENQFLRGDRDYLRVQLFHVDQIHHQLRDEHERVVAENQTLTRRVAELTASLRAAAEAGDAAKGGAAADLPDFVKPAARGRKKKPGRRAGHPAALRPMPQNIDVRQDVPLPVDDARRPSCPRCNACLADVRDHERLVEDVVPAKVLVKCFHTRSGWCPGCRKRVESRAREQPPAANLPHGQLGLNALATGVLLRVVHRLPFRQVAKVFADLPGLTVSPGAIARQVQRIANWLEGDYEQLVLRLRASKHVHADETGWRTDGRNGFLWTLATPTHTLLHVDKSRGGKVVRQLLGETFGGTLVSDFYSAYATVDCPKQKCLAHLLRELAETADESEAFAAGAFFPKAKRLVKQMLALKRRWDELGDDAYTTKACQLESRLKVIAEATYGEPHADRIAKRMRRHRDELTAFLWEKELEGTNNVAERALRPAVVARKISGGSRSDAGAAAWAKLASLLRTAGQQGQNVLETIKAMLMAAWETGNPAVVPRESG